MKKTVLGLTVAGVLLLAPLSPVAATPLIKIEYQVIDLPNTSAGDIWQYQYQVSQFNFPSGGGFDIFFDLDDGYLAGDLLEPLLPPNPDWSVLALQPDPLLPDDGRYDALARVNNPSLNGCFTQTSRLKIVLHPAGQVPAYQFFESVCSFERPPQTLFRECFLEFQNFTPLVELFRR